VQAQQNFAVFGASHEELIPQTRPPGPADRRDPGWRPIDPTRDRLEDPLPGQDHGADYPDQPATLYYWRRAAT
jgi:hypothetical protein